MTSGHKPLFSLEVNGYIKYDMTVDLLKYDQLLNRYQYFLIQCDRADLLPCNLYLTKLLIDYLLPVIINCLLVNTKCLLDSIRKLDPKLVCFPPTLGIHFVNDYIPMPQYLVNLSSKR